MMHISSEDFTAEEIIFGPLEDLEPPPDFAPPTLDWRGACLC
jgi:hypothetical protein